MVPWWCYGHFTDVSSPYAVSHSRWPTCWCIGTCKRLCRLLRRGAIRRKWLPASWRSAAATLLLLQIDPRTSKSWHSVKKSWLRWLAPNLKVRRDTLVTSWPFAYCSADFQRNLHHICTRGFIRFGVMGSKVFANSVVIKAPRRYYYRLLRHKAATVTIALNTALPILWALTLGVFDCQRGGCSPL